MGKKLDTEGGSWTITFTIKKILYIINFNIKLCTHTSVNSIHNLLLMIIIIIVALLL